MLLRVIKVKLSPTNEQAQRLLEVFAQFNAACNWISELAFGEKAFKQIPLHAACYHAVRARFGLPSQLAVRAIAKVLETYARDKSVCHQFGPYSAVVYDARLFRWIDVTFASMTTLPGREKIPLDCGSYQRKHLAGHPTIGQVDLLYDRGVFTLAVTIRRSELPPKATEGFLGIDLGIVEIATDSQGNQYSGEPVKACRRRLRKQRSGLQQCGKKEAKRRLLKIRRKQSRFVRHTNHVISKEIVKTALLSGKALALENLQGIRERASGYAREMRWLLGNWAFDQLGQFVVYKAADVGLPVRFVDPGHTSRTCPRCGYCAKANRKSQAYFQCLRCGFSANADYVGALNIEARGNVAYPKDVRLQPAL